MDLIIYMLHIVLQQRQVIEKLHPWLRSHWLLMAAGGKEGDQFSDGAPGRLPMPTDSPILLLIIAAPAGSSNF